MADCQEHLQSSAQQRPTGVVRHVEVTNAPDAEFAACISDVLYGLRFPAGTATVNVEYPFVLDVGATPPAGG